MFQGSSDSRASEQHHNAAADMSFGWLMLEGSLFASEFNFSKLLNEPLPQGAVGHEEAGQQLSFAQQAHGCSIQPSQQQENSFGHPDLLSQPGIQLSIQSPGFSSVNLLAEEVKQIHDKLSELKMEKDQLALHVENNEMIIKGLQEEVTLLTEKLKQKVAATTKNVSNKYPILKSRVHNIMQDMCAINRLGAEDHTNKLCKYKDGLPDKKTLEVINGQVICYTQAVIDSVMAEEKVRHDQGGSELSNNEYNCKTIGLLANQYWHSLAANITNMVNPERQVKQRCHLKGVVAMIDTDFGLDYHTIHEDALSENLKAHCKVQDIPSNGWMKYIAFIHILDGIHKAK
ncbi:hypothetical protein V8B97DRAFT_1920441 [Scleroderma yunnanense]